MRKRRAVFLDRDGVLNHAVCVDGKSCPPANAANLEIVPNAREAVRRLQAAGYLCICVTNQPDVARGTRTLENVTEMNDKVRVALGLDDLYACLHDNADHCACRKPKAGMLLAAAEKWDIDLPSSWMIGDRPSDIAAGIAAGCRTVRVGGIEENDCGADQVCAEIGAAVTRILGGKAHDGESIL